MLVAQSKDEQGISAQKMKIEFATQATCIVGRYMCVFFTAQASETDTMLTKKPTPDPQHSPNQYP